MSDLEKYIWKHKEKIGKISFQVGLGGILTTMLSTAWLFSAYALIYENQFMPSIAEGGRPVDYLALIMGIAGGLVWMFAWLLCGILSMEYPEAEISEKEQTQSMCGTTLEYPPAVYLNVSDVIKKRPR